MRLATLKILLTIMITKHTLVLGVGKGLKEPFITLGFSALLQFLRSVIPNRGVLQETSVLPKRM